MTSPSRCPLLRLQNFKLVNQNMWSKKHHGRSKFGILRPLLTMTTVQAVPATRGRPVVDDPRFFFLAPSSALRSSLCSHDQPPRDQEKKRRSSVLRRRSPPQDVSRPLCAGVRYRCVIDLYLFLYLYLYLSLQVVTYSQYGVP